MKKLKIYYGFHPETQRSYEGEYIYKVIRRRSPETGDAKSNHWLLEHGVWIREVGPEKYVTDWTNEERWGRIEEITLNEKGDEIHHKDLGFILIRVDRLRGLL